MRMSEKYLNVVMATLVSLSATVQAATITGVTAQQRYPWNGKVDISYTITGDIATESKQKAFLPSLKITATDKTAGTTYTATQLSGDTALTAGAHSLIWDMDAEGLSFKSSNVVFKVSCEATPALYCVIDLSAGANASSYPVTYLTEQPSGGFNTDEYKTTKLVLRRIESGSFIMGDDQSDENHRVTITKPFFAGIFEVTQKQYELIMGENPAEYAGDMRPVEKVSYDTIRGSLNGAQWPSSSDVDTSSFMGKLRTRTAIDFDLPTEAQWEYACRAGTTSKYNNGGDTEDDMRLLGRYYGDRSDNNGGYSGAHTIVGSYQPNAWNLYDMHGNVQEWCLDWRADVLQYGTDPNGATTGENRRQRGGCWHYEASQCRSAYANNGNPSKEGTYVGFRVFVTMIDDQDCSLCSCESLMADMDLGLGCRTTATVVQIRYSTDWMTDAVDGAQAVITVNGETLNVAFGTGFVDWTPMSNGTYTLTHKVVLGETQYGEILTATFLVTELPDTYSETQTTEIPVPYVWLSQYDPDIANTYDSYEAAAKAVAANGLKVWECYLAGLDPTNATSTFTASIEVSNGVPLVTWTPNLNDNGVVRKYTVLGKTNLIDAAEWAPTNSAHRFFKVKVEMP